MQMIYQIISAYFKDDCADELTLDPVFNAILEKNSLASQPVMRRIIVPTYGSFTANQIRHLPYIVSPNVLYITARFFLSY